MSLIIRQQSQLEAQTENVITHWRNSLFAFRRMLSTDSTTSSAGFTVSEQFASQQTIHNLSTKPEFVLKIFQLLNGIVCAGLYSNAIRLMQHSVESMVFPNVVFSAYIIITSVIALSYVLGNAMRPTLIRIFNMIGMTLYFSAACVTLVAWNESARYMNKPEDIISANMLLGQSCLSLINVCVHGCDIFFSVRKSLALENS